MIYTKNQYSYDLVVGNDIKVDIKVAKPNKVGIHEFATRKKEPTCDLYVLYALADDGTILKRLIVPSCVLRGREVIGVRKRSKWNIYADRWDYFDQYTEFYNSLKKNA